MNNTIQFLLLTVIAVFPLNATAQEDITKSNPLKAAEQESTFIKDVRQLTFEGRRAGEGYFSADGKQMVFQSERQEGNPFYQIYLMDFETGDVDRVSPGDGKTTCAWIHPNGKKVLFASTHADPDAKKKQQAEIEIRASGKERRYAWDYDEFFELWEFDQNTGKYKQLTDAKGYDAEASWSPDGNWIAFASNRAAYQRKLSEAEQKLFDVDKAYMNDIYLMRADGSELKQLTDTPGYDGGPFFSADGKKICWRRFSDDGAMAEIMTMNVDGSNKRQITRMNAMSWAPYFHPSGDYLIFTTNKHGFGNFELYIVAAEGPSVPVRVSYTDGFDGLPVFTPDGNKLSWTSTRASSKKSQIYVGDWNHDQALKSLGIDAEESNTQPAVDHGVASSKLTDASFQPEDIMRHVDYLCRKELGGRLTGSKGEKLATAYVAAYLDNLGLVPDAGDGEWFQPFDFPAGAELGKNNQLTLNRKEGKSFNTLLNKQWRPTSFSKTGKFEPTAVVFAGYGIVAPAKDDAEEYDSYVHLDVKDKWVMMFRYMPEGISPERRQQLSLHSSLRYKAMVARDRGARGIIVVSGPSSKVRNQLIPLQKDSALAGTSIGAISVTDELAEELLSKNGKKLGELQAKLDEGGLMMGFEIKDLKVSAEIDVNQVLRSGRNVIGRLVVGEKPSEEAILVGAHIDHLGIGPSSSSLAKDDRNGIHVGADDNASGVAAMLEVAEYLADQKRAGKLKANRDIIFAAWSGEEMGLHGSQAYVDAIRKQIMLAHAHGGGHGHSHPHDGNDKQHAKDPHAKDPHAKDPHAKDPLAKDPHAKDPHAKDPHAKDPHAKDPHAKDPHAKDPHVKDPHAPNPHQANPHGEEPAEGKHGAGQHVGALKAISIYPNIAACLNMDMVGRFDKKLILQGIASSNVWRSEIEKRNAPVGLPIALQEDTDLRTDATSFYQAGVPILSAFTGSHSDYHTPRDTPEKLNYEKASQIAKLMGLITRGLAISDTIPTYIEKTADGTKKPRAALRAYLGSVPDYGQDVTGVLLSGVTKGAPAEKAGVKAGDIIIELAGRKIENIYDYTYAIEALKIGQKTKIKVKRGDKTLELDLIPASRD